MSCRLTSREDIIKWMNSMLNQDGIYKGNTGSAYGEDIRKIEELSRPLWGIFSLIASNEVDENCSRYISKIKKGLDRSSTSPFIDVTTKTRQIAVEMAVYGFGLAYCKEKFLKYFSLEEKERLESWLNSINNIEFPEGNWYFFLLFTNMGLKLNGMKYSKEKLELALNKIESFYLGDGWYSDGPYEHMDYYIAFAFHFYGLLYSKLLPECEEKNKYLNRAEIFAKDFIYWFDEEGKSLPYGRSLTYRFAHSAFFAALIIAESKIFSLEVLKGFLFRNMNWWYNQPMYNQDGTLSIGYSYPNLIMSEDYNAPGSPMWAFKAFIILLLPKEHKIWKVKEVPYKKYSIKSTQKHPGFIIMKDPRGTNNYALSSRQYSKGKINHCSEKYCKFCYSTYFGWNLTRDQEGINNFACDSAIALSVNGTSQYFSRDKIIYSMQSDKYSYSKWLYGDIAEIKTWLIPIDYKYHIRIHEINTKLELESYEGAFPIFNWNPKFREPDILDRQIILDNEYGKSGIEDIFGNRTPRIVLQNPNTNIYNFERNAIASLYGIIPKGQVILGALVYGSPYEGMDIKKKPSIKIYNNIVTINYNNEFIKITLENFQSENITY